VLAGIALAGWTYLALFHGRFWRTKPLLQAPAAWTPPGTHPKVAAVIPARDEAATVTRAVASLCRQDYAGPFHIWLVDDGSYDGTAQLARAAGGTQVTVLDAGPLQAGWTGKLWALSRGVEQAISWTPDYLLFTDADIEHGPSSVRQLVARAEAERLDLVSNMVKLHCSTLAERFTMPAFVFFFFLLYPPAAIRDSRSRAAGAAGGCILIRSAALQRAGGLASIRSELIDDCALAQVVKQSGGKLRLQLTPDTHSLRVYRTLLEVERMIARTAFTQLRYSAWALAGTVAGLGLLFGIPVWATLRRMRTGVAAWSMMTLLYAPVVRLYGQPLILAATLPFSALFYAAATAHSAVLYWRGRGGAWKGRHQAAAIPLLPPAILSEPRAHVPELCRYRPQ
jgi:hopene-associated glycosyltransferase HpnB